MPRVARVVVPGVPHHLTQRGNNRQDVFFTDEDRRFYLETLKQHSERFGVEVCGYCLMTNHVHLVVTPAAEDSLAKAIGRTHFQYSQYINRFHGRSGHLWQTGSIRLRWTQFTSWPPCVMRSAILAGSGWCGCRGGTCGQVRQLIAARGIRPGC